MKFFETVTTLVLLAQYQFSIATDKCWILLRRKTLGCPANSVPFYTSGNFSEVLN